MAAKRKYSKQWYPHRRLRKGMKGRDVKKLQQAINQRRKNRHLPRIAEDGVVGPQTIKAFGGMAIAIGLKHRKLTVGQQTLMRWPSRRDRAMKARAARKARAVPMRVRSLRTARSLLGVMEQGGNNVGPMVSKIIRANGGTPGEPWCGDFVAWCYRAAGSKVVTRAWAAVRYLGFLTGMKRVSSPAPGDIVCYSFSHTGLFLKWESGGYFLAIEGNTGRSGAVSDSRTGGDGVYIKRRHRSQVTRWVRVTR